MRARGSQGLQSAFGNTFETAATVRGLRCCTRPASGTRIYPPAEDPWLKLGKVTMPPVELWEGCLIVEFGCGYGTPTAARRILGSVYAADIAPLMVRATRQRATEAGVENVVVEARDLLAEGCGRLMNRRASLSNILHIEDPVRLLHRSSWTSACWWRCGLGSPDLLPHNHWH
jgi:SAM-dependent methyltransferase